MSTFERRLKDADDRYAWPHPDMNALSPILQQTARDFAAGARFGREDAFAEVFSIVRDVSNDPRGAGIVVSTLPLRRSLEKQNRRPCSACLGESHFLFYNSCEGCEARKERIAQENRDFIEKSLRDQKEILIVNSLERCTRSNYLQAWEFI